MAHNSLRLDPLLPRSIADPTNPALDIRIVPLRESIAALAGFLTAAPPSSHVGITVHVLKGRVSRVALATRSRVVLLTIGKAGVPKTTGDAFQRVLTALPPLVEFDLPSAALHVWRDLGCRLDGRDLGMLEKPASSTSSSPAYLFQKLAERVVLQTGRINSLWSSHKDEDIIHRAWLSSIIGQRFSTQLSAGGQVSSMTLPSRHLDCLSNSLLEDHLLDAAKPRVQKNDFSEAKLGKSNDLKIINSRYKTRVRPSNTTKVVITNSAGKTVHGSAGRAKGKTTSVKVTSAGFAGDIKSIVVIGKEELTNAEKAKNAFVASLLWSLPPCRLDGARLNRLVFLPSNDPPDSPTSTANHASRAAPSIEGLNQSQANAANAIVSGASPIVVVQGPPGTGKTTTIALAVKRTLASHRKAAIWIVAQSNVAVKNIAEKLARKVIPFRLVVSKEFHEEWHEHLYEVIEQSTIRSDKLPKLPRDLELKFAGARVILCTLSTLSSSTLQKRGVFNLVPVERLIVDEASQISIYAYMHVFNKFEKLRQVSFFGDHKQLPPFGKETAKTMRSVFDLAHLMKDVYFLDTQYRMPTLLGDFISNAVYDSKLRSVHRIKDFSFLSFVDVSNGEEQQGKGSFSWANQKEVQVIVHLVKKYYRKKQFCIITPYDAQRAAIELALKNAKLPWENVYNVDSFQGNEAPFVIVSIVRTTKPGFMTAQERVNVMLTRCKEGMVIVSNRHLLTETPARDTLLGGLAGEWTVRYPNAWVAWNAVAAGTARMPN